MDPGTFVKDGDYWNGILNPDEVVANTPKNFRVIVGADVQDVLGPGDDDLTADLLGPFCEGCEVA